VIVFEFGVPVNDPDGNPRKGPDGRPVIADSVSEWISKLPVKARATVRNRINALRQATAGKLPPGLMDGPLTGYPHIYEIKIGGKPALRPLLCRGPRPPGEMRNEVTLLVGAEERDKELQPPPKTAEDRRQHIMAHPECRHRYPVYKAEAPWTKSNVN
jgi:hypothetical protein